MTSPQSFMLPGRCEHPEPDQLPLFSARDYISGDTFTVRVCLQCGLARTSPVPDDEAKHRYYPPAYYGEARRYVFPVDYLLNRLQARRSGQIHSASGGQAGWVLDVGCGRGVLLHQLRRLGWTVTGTERSNGAARFAREVLHLNVLVGELRDLGLEERSFDAVVLWHVLEHVDEPASLIHEVSTLIRPGGLFLVAVPNFGSIEANLSKAGWFHLDVPRHVSHFTSETLARLLEAEDFATERINYVSPEYDVFSFVQSTLNRLGIQQNLLYELLRVGPAKLLTGTRIPGHARGTVVSLALAPFLGLLALAWQPLAARLHRGATMTVYARKAGSHSQASSAAIERPGRRPRSGNREPRANDSA